jgi:hypothetical protein
MFPATIIAVLSVATLWTIYTNVCTICSFLHATLPPWDFLAPYPRIQNAYKVFIYVIGYVALNARSTVYKSISVTNGPQSPQPKP